MGQKEGKAALVGRACVSLLLVGVACAAPAQGRRGGDVVGTWSGRATFRAAPLDFTVRFFRQHDSLRATFSSPELLILEQPLDSVRLDGARVSFSTPDDYPIHFQGTLTGDAIHGGAGVPAVPGVTERRRASDPSDLQFELHRAEARASPFVTREVVVANGSVHLAGTLLVPPHPANTRLAGIVILQGSSTNLRREYQFYADHFARAGLAVLTFDKRGKGESSGDYGAATYDDLASDAAAAVAFLGRQSGIDSTRVGVWGLSQGAFIAPLVARRVPSLAFIVAVSPPGVLIGESAAYQDSVRVIARGFPATDASRAAQLNRHIYEWLRDGGSGSGSGSRSRVDAELATSAEQAWGRVTSLPARLPTGSSLDGWYWRGRILDPIPSWRALRTPVLVVFGAADELVPASLSAARIQTALREGGNRDAGVRVFPAANHVLRQLPLVAGGKWDWPKAAAGYLDGITEWIVAHSR